MPRGRTYVRNGSVIDLQIAAGEIKALVSGSEIYEVVVRVAPVGKARWKSICRDCAGAIDSLIELLEGRFSKGVMERVCRQKTGLFPSPNEIELSCSCPDWAGMCKHIAAVLYGIGARWTNNPISFSGCINWTKKNSLPGPQRGFRWPRIRRPQGRSSAAQTLQLSSDWTWLLRPPRDRSLRQCGPARRLWRRMKRSRRAHRIVLAGAGDSQLALVNFVAQRRNDVTILGEDRPRDAERVRDLVQDLIHWLARAGDPRALNTFMDAVEMVRKDFGPD